MRLSTHWLLAVVLVWMCFGHVSVAMANTEDGIVVSAGEGKIVIKDSQGRDHSHDVGPSVKITVNGKPGKLEDLKPGMDVHIVLNEEHEVVSITTKDSDKDKVPAAAA